MQESEIITTEMRKLHEGEAEIRAKFSRELLEKEKEVIQESLR